MIIFFYFHLISIHEDPLHLKVFYFVTMKYSAIGLSRVDEIAQWFGVPDHNPDNLSSSPGAHGETIQAAHKSCLLSLHFCIMGTFTYLPTIIKHMSTYTYTHEQ